MPAIKKHSTATSDAVWNGPKMKAALKLDQDAAFYSEAFAWEDPESDPKLKGSYRFIHHFVDADGDPGEASTTACMVGMGVLNGAMGGTTIPDADRPGVHAHLAAHVMDAGMDVPALKSFGPQSGNKEANMPAMREVKQIPFEIKEIGDNGEFDGIASPYGNIDHGNDIVEPGAFTKTIAERGDRVRLLDSHKVRIGLAAVAESPSGLAMKGKINLEKQAGRDAYSDLKFYRDHGQPMGLSIGYEAMKVDPPGMTKDGARHLKEVRLWEISITEFPMNEEAQVLNVKEQRPDEENVEFGTALDLARDNAAEVKRLCGVERKAGRRLSAASRAKLQQAMEQLQALMADEAAMEMDTAKEEQPPESKSTPPPEAAPKTDEPEDLHSTMANLLEAFKWN